MGVSNSATSRKRLSGRHSFLGVAALIAASLLPAGLRPQSEGQTAKTSDLQHQAGVVLKLVQVYVLDKKGEPVNDLELKDFVLRDNGREQTINAFERHGPPAGGRNQGPAPVAPGVRDDRESLNRKFFFVFDLSQSNPRGFRAAKQMGLTLLKNHSQPTDEFALLTYSYSGGLIFREYLTTNQSRIAQRIEGLREMPGLGMDADSRSARVESEDLGAGYDGLAPVPNADRDRFMHKTADFAAALEGLARALRGVAGFKNIILFSSGISEKLIHDESDHGIRQNLGDMMTELSSSACPIFTVDTDIVKDDKMSGEPSLLFEERDPNALLLSERGSGLLRQIARKSGGRYYSNPEKSEAVAKSIDAVTASYYVLGYTIDGRWDGAFHKIRVEVKREGCSVATPEGYFNPKPFADWSEFEKKLQVLDLATSASPHLTVPVPLPVAAFPILEAESGAVLLISEVRADALPGIGPGPTELLSIVFNPHGGIVQNTGNVVELSPAAGRNLYLYDLARLPAGTFLFRLILRNPKTGAAARGDVRFRVPEYAPGKTRLSAPFLFTIHDGVSFARIKKPADVDPEAKGNDAGFLQRMLPFISGNTAPVIDVLAGPVPAIYGIVHFTGSRGSGPEAKFESALFQKATGRSIPVEALVRDFANTETADILLLEFPLPDLEPGSYELRLTIEDQSSGGKAESSREFRLIKN
jgi:VWFA-related protein